MNAHWLPDAPWFPVTAPFTSGTHERSVAILETCIAQFDVEVARRYRPVPADPDNGVAGATYCNIYAVDLTAALGAALPRAWPVAADGKVSWKERSANDLWAWLQQQGPRHGWELVTEHVAQRAADEGQVAVAVWRNPGEGSGHIAVLRPSRGEAGVWITQAGARNFARCRLEQGFGGHRPAFFFHP